MQHPPADLPPADPPAGHLGLEGLADRHPGAWDAATGHRFLDGVRDGTLPVPAFDVWLAQDALFVADLLAFQARLLARAPRAAQRTLAAGALALVEELDWFDRLAAERGLDLSAAPLPATRAYAQLLARLDAAPYADAVGGLWLVERVYLDAWTGALPGAGGYAELVAHWTTPQFGTYVAQLQALAAAAGGTAEREQLLRDVLEHEAAFWEMAFDGGPGSPALAAP